MFCGGDSNNAVSTVSDSLFKSQYMAVRKIWRSVVTIRSIRNAPLRINPPLIKKQKQVEWGRLVWLLCFIGLQNLLIYFKTVNLLFAWFR